MTNGVMSLVSLVAQQAKRRFIQKTRYAEATQAEFLRSLLRDYQNTAFGQDFNFSKLQTVEQFRSHVPILNYTAYDPYVQRVAQGEANILTPDPVVSLNLTSGTTGKQKLIPTTRRSRQVLTRSNQAGLGFCLEAAQRRGLPIGKMMLTSYARPTGYTAGGIPYGPISANDLRGTAFLFRQVFAHPFEALQIADSESRHYICLLFALREAKLRSIGANFPVLALRCCDYLERFTDDLLWDLETGELAAWLKLDSELRLKLERQWSANPKRAAELRAKLRTDRLTPKAAWDLSFLITARGGTSDFYFDRFEKYFGDLPIFGGTYASSEGTFGVHRDFNTDGAILAIESGFFEFIPIDQWEADQPQTLLPHEVTPGELYRVVMSNHNGLFRYDNGDVVEIEGFYHEAPMMIFRHRHGGMLSSTSEKTTEYHAVKTLQTLQQEFDLALENFCITLSPDEIPPHYLVNIELATGQTLAEPQRFITRFDQILQEIHTSYALKRVDQVPPPRLRILASGSFAQVRQQMIQRGIPENQLKFPHISVDRQFLNGATVLREVAFIADRAIV